jgi:mycothiol synthase
MTGTARRRASGAARAASAQAAAGPTLRPFDRERDWEAAAELVGRTNRHDGVDWLPTATALRHDWLTTPSFEPERDACVAELEGRMVGLAAVDWRVRADKVTHVAQIWVAPEERRRGLGRRLLAWAEERAAASLRDGTGGPLDLPHTIGGFVDRDIVGGEAFAASAGYVPVRYFFMMIRPLDEPIPDAPLPDGLVLRPVRPDDHRAIWDADVEAFRDHWESAARTEDDYRGLFDHPDIDPGLWVVAWDGDQVAGSVLNWIFREENERLGIRRGWLEHVSVRRPWRRRGLASALIAESLRVLRAHGMTEGALGVDAENPSGALRLYEGLGFRVYRTDAVHRKDLPLD